MVPAVSVPIAPIARAHALRERAAEEATEGRTKPRRSPTTFTRVSASFIFSPAVGLRPFISLLCCASYIRIAAAVAGCRHWTTRSTATAHVSH